MSTGATEEKVAGHYAQKNLEERILQALEAGGKPRATLTREELSAADEFHVGQTEATGELARQMSLAPGMKLLDVGCGIGGPARYFAAVHGCDVTGVDLTEDFVRTAQALTERVNKGLSVRFQQASALQLPFADKQFEGAYLLHVGMNLADKNRVFAEIGRVLQPGAVFAVYDVMRVGPGEFSFPVPWAGSSEQSFVATREEYLEALDQAGFTVETERERRAFAIEFFRKMREQREPQGANAVNVQLLMGESAPQKVANLVDAMQRGVLAPVEMIARRN